MLIPCPFCGTAQPRVDDLVWHFNGWGPPPSYAVICDGCGAHGPLSRGRERDDHDGARADAIRLWNQRTAQLGGRSP
jgi:Lar family restriction alleviation protein